MSNALNECTILNKGISLEIALPKKLLGAFIHQFGEAFCTQGFGDDFKSIATVDDYYSINNGIIGIKVTVATEHEAKLHTFLHAFSEENGMVFKNFD